MRQGQAEIRTQAARREARRTSVGAVGLLWLKSHGASVSAPAAVIFVESSRGVPGDAHGHGTSVRLLRDDVRPDLVLKSAPRRQRAGGLRQDAKVFLRKGSAGVNVPPAGVQPSEVP